MDENNQVKKALKYAKIELTEAVRVSTTSIGSSTKNDRKFTSFLSKLNILHSLIQHVYANKTVNVNKVKNVVYDLMIIHKQSSVRQWYPQACIRYVHTHRNCADRWGTNC